MRHLGFLFWRVGFFLYLYPVVELLLDMKYVKVLMGEWE